MSLAVILSRVRLGEYLLLRLRDNKACIIRKKTHGGVGSRPLGQSGERAIAFPLMEEATYRRHLTSPYTAIIPAMIR
jgi:hypothetical protein